MEHDKRCALQQQTAQGEALPATVQSLDRDGRDKVIQTLQAKAALLGCTLHLIDNGQGGEEYLLCRWNLSRTLPTLQSVEKLLSQLGGHHG